MVLPVSIRIGVSFLPNGAALRCALKGGLAHIAAGRGEASITTALVNSTTARMCSSDPSASAHSRQLLALHTDCDRLRQELDLRNCALDAATAHFMLVDMLHPTQPIVFVNRALAQTHGYEPAELIGTSALRLVDVDSCAPQLRQIGDAMRNGRILRTEIRSRRKDQSTFWAGIFLGPVHDAAGRVTHYVSVGADITARLEEEQARRSLQEQLAREMEQRERMAAELRIAHKLEAVGQLAAGIAHEINTPVQYVGDSVYFLRSALDALNGVLGAYRAEVDALTSEKASAEQDEDRRNGTLGRLREAERGADLEFLSAEVPKAFDRALAGVERVATIVRAMKEFAHPYSPEQSAADLNHAIETTLIVAQNEYKYVAGIDTQFGDIPEVMCNVGELNQVFLNLIVNASHAIQESGQDAQTGRITIATAQQAQSVLITIGDNGRGIPQENIERIFDPFFTTKEVGKGTGQGLAITRSIVCERHGGRITVQSQVGQGTQFSIALPIAGRRDRGAL